MPGVIGPVVDRAWLRDHPDVVLADVRFYLDGRSGRDAYEAGHLPGAVYVDMDTQLAAPADPQRGRHPLPDPEDFAREMRRLGIGDDDVVVAYDDQGGIMAARLVWMLRSTGHDAALLDGGLQDSEDALETGVATRPPAHFTARPWQRVATADDAADPSNVVVDARQRERFEGEPNPLDLRSGHIPGARSLPCRENLDADDRVLGVEQLREKFAAVGISGDEPVVSYCGSGVTACHNLLTIEHAGLGQGRLFPGSWSQWSADEERPVET